MTDAEPREDVTLPADLGPLAAPALKDTLLAALALGRPCQLDARAVATVSTAAIQVLLAATRHQAARGLALRLVAPSPALCQAIAELGLATDFDGCGGSNG